MESLRQRKVSRLIQKELSIIFQKQSLGLFGVKFISITIVRVSQDLSVAKVYLSFIDSIENKKDLLIKINKSNSKIRNLLSRNVRSSLKKIPELRFFIDDSFDYYKKINSLLSKNEK
ncbi:MAG: ribosome-binding factor A [Flavobacteriales bacterium]|nr:ribosome-binding factor A [Flavobacteriales bacterium]|tara:strand:- start:239 stop:589 length:351 start_codon:yes stop_codon:yes gene_type:complete